MTYLRFLQDITGLPSLASKHRYRYGPIHITEMLELEVQEEGAGDRALRTCTCKAGKEKQPALGGVRERKASQREEHPNRQAGGTHKCGLWSQPQILVLPPTK